MLEEQMRMRLFQYRHCLELIRQDFIEMNGNKNKMLTH
jgi:hypothetical protein